MLATVIRFSRRHHLALLALIVALTGTAYATQRAGKIGSKQIKTDAIKARHIAPGAVGDSEADEGSFGVLRSGRVNIDDPGGAPPTEKTIFTYGPFTLKGSCQDNGATWTAGATIASSQPAYGFGTSDATDPDDIGSTAKPLAGGTSAQAGGVTTQAVTLFTPSGRYMSVGIFELRRPSALTDCAFWVSGQGR